MSIIQSSLTRLLRPLVRVLLRQGMTFDEFTEVGKRVYVDVAESDFKLEGRKQTISRIAMLTGIQRKEVSRLQKLGLATETELDSAYNRGVRIMAGWRRDAEFCDSAGEPDALPMEGIGSFSALVKRYSGDLPARAVFDEFIRIGVVEINDQDQVALKNEAGFVPTASEVDQLNILGQSTADLLETISHNISSDDDKRLQLTVAYNNLSLQSVEAFKKKSQKESFALLKSFDKWLSTQDGDTSPNAQQESSDEPSERMRAGVGIYFFQESYQEVIEA